MIKTRLGCNITSIFDDLFWLGNKRNRSLGERRWHIILMERTFLCAKRGRDIHHNQCSYMANFE
ncbi:hypothetical protein FQR65_LT17962 [Abscondita terminalis]|nr:hypothetical protein FQR65_LT17962 [Abscondita terminalis]